MRKTKIKFYLRIEINQQDMENREKIDGSNPKEVLGYLKWRIIE